MKYIVFIISFFFSVSSLFSQLDSIQNLDEVIIDANLKNFSDGYQTLKLSDSIINKNKQSLTAVLKWNSPIFFKENGYGMVSSASFRGTNASQTAVIWNGIAINSVLTGQTDFNILMPDSFNDIIVRSGGGSSIYGSGAVGGSIHLNNNLNFKEEDSFELNLEGGSFTSLLSHSKYEFSDKKRYVDAAVSFSSSKNDYQFIGKNKKNTNGAFIKMNASTNLGYKIGKNTFSFHYNYFYGNRDFSSTLTTISKDNYKDISSKTLWSWNYASNKISSTLKAAHLFEKYRYFPNKNKDLFFFGKANSYIGDYTFDYNISKKIKISVVSNFTHIKGAGSNIFKNNRNTLATVLLLKHHLNSKFVYNLNFRKEYFNNFKNPLLFSLDSKYQISKTYSISFNASKNYRIPSFNDLYWENGGNKNLQAETSLQAELGNYFSNKFITVSANIFYIRSKDLIQWRPNSNNVWTPINVSNTTNYGIESKVNLHKFFNNHLYKLQIAYSYTKAIDLEKNTQLIYVPYHKIIGLFDYSVNHFSAYFQTLFNGEVFTTTDNNTVLPSYFVFNLGLSYTINNSTKLGLKVNNIFNTYYENVAYRPMPNRNLQLFINFKI